MGFPQNMLINPYLHLYKVKLDNHLSFLYLLFWCIDINDSKEKLNSSDQSAINKKYISAIILSVYYIIFQ